MKADSYYARLKSILDKRERGTTLFVSRRVLEGVIEEMEEAARQLAALLPPEREWPEVWVAWPTVPKLGAPIRLAPEQALYRTATQALAAGVAAVRIEGIDAELLGWRIPPTRWTSRGWIEPMHAGRAVAVREMAELVTTRPGANAVMVDLGAGRDPEKE